MDKTEPQPTVSQADDSARKVYYRLGGLLLSFAFGAVSFFVLRYLFSGKTLQLAPDVFISLVFTVAIGAASLVLALLAINYGRISERVITERADRSIEIQMSLFEKSLDLQTRLFDKTTSTLESIGRSTGVTEQRLGDMLSMFQNPVFMKQVAGRAVEETASELGKKTKESEIDTQTETQLAEKLTQNIVRELSARFEALERAARGPASPTGSLSSLATTQGTSQAQSRESQQDSERSKLYLERAVLIRKVIESIPEAVLLDAELAKFWDFIVEYKGKTIAIDSRLRPPSRMSIMDESIKDLLSHPVDCLVFAFTLPPSNEFVQKLETRNRLLGGKLKYVVGEDHSTLHNELLGIFESVAAALPSPE